METRHTGRAGTFIRPIMVGKLIASAQKLVHFVNNLKKSRSLTVLGFFFLAVAFVTIYSTTTSPLTTYLGADSAIFRLIGTAMHSGKSLYVDVSDNKGPFLFFIELLGQLVSPGRVGIYIVQIVFLFGTLFFLWKMAKLFLPNKYAWIVVIAVIVPMSFFYEGGNLSEEFSLFFCSVAMFLTTRQLNAKPEPRFKAMMVTIGVLLGISFFIRVNNAAPIIACIIPYLITIARRNGNRVMMLHALHVLMGFLVLSAIVIIYFLVNNSLGEMIYDSFIFNVHYASFNPKDIPLLISRGYLQWATFGSLICLTAAWYYYRKPVHSNTLVLISIALSIICPISVLTSTTGYYHYLQMTIPVYVVSFILILILSQKWIKEVMVIILFVSIYLLTGSTLNIFHNYATVFSDSAYTENVNDLLKTVPQHEKPLIFGYNTPAKYYLATNTLPSYRHFTLQDWWSSYDKTVRIDTENYFQKTKPLWVVTGAPILNSPYIQNELLLSYRVTATNKDNYILYRLIE